MVLPIFDSHTLIFQGKKIQRATLTFVWGGWAVGSGLFHSVPPSYPEEFSKENINSLPTGNAVPSEEFFFFFPAKFYFFPALLRYT